MSSHFGWHYKSIRFIAMLTFMAVCGFGSSTAQTTEIPVPAQLFSMSMNAGVVSREPWPTVSFTGLRILEGGASWNDINTAHNVYNWSTLDLWLAAAAQHGDDVLYTFAETPKWASSKPGDTSCNFGPNSEGACDPPSDLNADGSGADEIWKTFVTALVLHNKNSKTGHIKYWEMWNEPYNAWEFNGTYAQMVRMARDARYVIKKWDPTAVVLTPTLNWNTQQELNWAAGYLAAGGGNFADAIALHGYVFGAGQTDDPETIATLLPPYKKVLSTYGQSSKQIINTEACWGITANWNYSNPDLQASFVARLYLLNAAYGISRLYWFEWNNTGAGTLWLQDSSDPSGAGTLLESGLAYREVESWMTGKNISCSSSGSVWSCSLSGPNGYLSEAIWDTAETCSDGDCTTIEHAVAPTYTKYQTLSGTSVNITGSTVPIGLKPILVEN